jgi:hypothetical protein
LKQKKNANQKQLDAGHNRAPATDAKPPAKAATPARKPDAAAATAAGRDELPVEPGATDHRRLSDHQRGFSPFFGLLDFLFNKFTKHQTIVCLFFFQLYQKEEENLLYSFPLCLIFVQFEIC